MQSGLPTPPLLEADGTTTGLLDASLLESLSLRDKTSSAERLRYERKLGDSEMAFYLPSRQMGVNDMYQALSFRAVERVMRRSRVRVAWALMRLRHPILASSVEMHSYDDARFVYHAPKSADDALLDANNTLDYCVQSEEALIEKYVNGPRTLSDKRLSHLTISQPGVGVSSLPTPPSSPAPSSSHSFLEHQPEEMYDYVFFLCAGHFTGDGMSLLDLTKEFFDIVGCDKMTCQLECVLRDEWNARFSEPLMIKDILPVCAEDRLPAYKSRLRRAAAKVDFLRDQQKYIGGQVFPRRQSKERRICTRVAIFDAEKTAQILKKCKSQRVSVSLVVFALCHMAWARKHPESKDLPMMMYSALSLRPYLKPARPLSSDFFLAVGYFNIVLPSFIPEDSDEAKIFWLRARSARDQCARTAKSPMLPYRSREMAAKRAQQARAWAVIDDASTALPSPPKVPAPPIPQAQTQTNAGPRAPSATLLGVSSLGNLNSLSEHAKGPLFELKSMIPGVRQRSGGMLLFSFTFAKKWWFVLHWDELGYEREAVDTFWKGVLGGVDEFLC